MTFFLFWLMSLAFIPSPCRTLSSTSHSAKHVPKGWQIEMNKQLLSRENVESLLDLFERHGLSFDVVNLATTCHRIAKLSKKTGATHIRIDPLAAACRKNMHLFDAKGLAITAWAFATLDVEDEGLLDDLADHAGTQAYRCKGLEIANLAWAYARVGGRRRTDLFDRLAAVAVDRIDTFSSQNVARVAWAYAKSGTRAPELFDAIARVVPLKVDDYSSHALANVLWAFATIQHDAPLLFDAVADVIVKKKVCDFNPHDLSNTAWAFGQNTAFLSSLSQQDRALLFQRIADRAAVLIHHLSMRDVAIIASAFAKSGVEAPRLFQLIAHVSQLKIAHFKPRELADLLVAFAKLNQNESSLFATAALYHQQNPRQRYEPREISDLAWAFATAGEPAPSVFSALYVLIDRRFDEALGEKRSQRSFASKPTAQRHDRRNHHGTIHTSSPSSLTSPKGRQ